MQSPSILHEQPETPHTGGYDPCVQCTCFLVQSEVVLSCHAGDQCPCLPVIVPNSACKVICSGVHGQEDSSTPCMGAEMVSSQWWRHGGRGAGLPPSGYFHGGKLFLLPGNHDDCS